MKDLAKYKNILITTCKNPDMDGYACVVVYSTIINKLVISNQPAFFGKLLPEPKHILKRYKIKPIKSIIKTNNFDAVILLDCSVDFAVDKSINRKKIIQIIDHHKNPELKYFPNVKFQYEKIGSLTTYFVELAQKKHLVINKKTAILLYAAIISNTLNLKAYVTTDRDKKVINYLEKIVKISKNKFAHSMFLAKSDLSGSKLLNILKDDIAVQKYSNKILTVMQLEIIGIEKVIQTRSKEINKILEKFKKKYNSNITFVNIIGLKEEYNIIYALEPKTQKILSKILNIKFKNNIARTKRLWMRKEIMPKLEEYLTNLSNRNVRLDKRPSN